MEKLKISTSVGLFRVPTEDIAYIEASGNYCDVHLFNGEVVTMTFQLHYFVEALNNLKQNFFTRVGKSLIVNKNFVYAINVTSQDLRPRQTGFNNSLFTVFLERGLRGGADMNRDKVITAREIYDFVHQGVTNASGGRQHPVMWGKFDGNMAVIKW